MRDEIKKNFCFYDMRRLSRQKIKRSKMVALELEMRVDLLTNTVSKNCGQTLFQYIY